MALLVRYICNVFIRWSIQLTYTRNKSHKSIVRPVYGVSLLILLSSGSKASVLMDSTSSSYCEVICEWQPRYFNADCRDRNLLKIPPTAGLCWEAKYFDVRYNLIESISPRDFDQYKATRVLQLGNNNITEIPENMCGNSTKVELLQLNDNRLARIPQRAFCKLSILRHLALDNNQIQEVDIDAFHGLESLKELYLTNNNLVVLPNEVFKYLINLDKLNLGRNIIRSITSSIFHGLRKLRYLDLSHNMITTIQKKDIAEMPNLTKLMLRGNALMSFEASFYFGLPLKTLDLSRNKIETFDNMYGFLKQAVYLRQFYLEGNSLPCTCFIEPLRRWYRAHDPYEQSICTSPPDMEGIQLSLHNKTLCKHGDKPVSKTTPKQLIPSPKRITGKDKEKSNKVVVDVFVYLILGLAVLTIVMMIGMFFVFRQSLYQLIYPPQPPPYKKPDVSDYNGSSEENRQTPPKVPKCSNTYYDSPPEDEKVTPPKVPRRSSSIAPIARQISTGSATTSPDITTSYSKSPSKVQIQYF